MLSQKTPSKKPPPKKSQVGKLHGRTVARKTPPPRTTKRPQTIPPEQTSEPIAGKMQEMLLNTQPPLMTDDSQSISPSEFGPIDEVSQNAVNSASATKVNRSQTPPPRRASQSKGQRKTETAVEVGDPPRLPSPSPSSKSTAENSLIVPPNDTRILISDV